MRKLLFTAVTPTNSYDDNRIVVQVHPGPIGFAFEYTKASSTNIMISLEYGWISGDTPPAVGTDALWFAPSKHDGSVDNETTNVTAGRSFIDLSGRMPASSVGNTGFPGIIPTGVTHVRVRLKTTGTTAGVFATVTMFYNGPSTS